MSGKAWRRLWHLGGGAFLPILAFYLPLGKLLIVVYALASVSLAVEAFRLLIPKMNRWLLRWLDSVFKEKERAKLTGASYLLFATIIVFLVFDKEIAILSLLFLALGDPVAATFGEKFGKRKVWGKSLEGTLAGFLACVILGLLLVNSAIPFSQPAVIAGAASAAIVELLPLSLDDNLTIPLASATIMALIS